MGVVEVSDVGAAFLASFDTYDFSSVLGGGLVAVVGEHGGVVALISSSAIVRLVRLTGLFLEFASDLIWLKHHRRDVGTLSSKLVGGGTQYRQSVNSFVLWRHISHTRCWQTAHFWTRPGVVLGQG